MSKIKTSMATRKQPMYLVLVAALAVALTGVMNLGSAVIAAPVAQNTQSQEVTGVVPGGQSAQIWLGLNPQTPAQNVTLVSTWDRVNPTNNGVGFYVLTAAQTRAVLSGANLGANNLAAGSRLSPQSPDNEVGAVFGGTAGPYTVVIYNNSNADAVFTLSVDNGVLVDDSGQVTDVRASDEDEDEADDAAEEVAEDAAPAATPAPVATTAPAATPAPVAAETEDEDEAEASETTETTQVVVGAGGVVRSPVMEGELPEQFDQHFFAFEPDGRNVDVRIVLAFDPQDQPEVARRLNFWVLDDGGFRRYVDPGNTTPPGSLALAAGNTANSLALNERFAEFTTSGSGTYVVIVYNNSNIPASYRLTAEGGQFVDDSQQSLTAQRGGVATATVETDEEGAAATTTTTTTTTTTAATTPATTAGTRTGTPGGTYMVQAGDTLSLIARDVLGNMNAWRDICNLNQLADCNRIEVGTELQLPTAAQIGTTQAPAPAATPAATTRPATTGTATTTTTTTTTMADDEADEEEDAVADEEEEEASDTSADASVDLVAALRAAGSFGTLVEALEAANLTDALVTGGPFTIFAPTDAAFAALPAGAMEQLLNQPTGQLTQILLFHVLPGRVGSDDVSDGMQATTQQGRAVRFELDGSTVQVNGANVVAADIGATNGVIHAIDAVILPPTD